MKKDIGLGIKSLGNLGIFFGVLRSVFGNSRAGVVMAASGLVLFGVGEKLIKKED